MLPKPPEPLSVSERIVTSSHCAVSCLQIIICAIRSPFFIIYSLSDKGYVLSSYDEKELL